MEKLSLDFGQLKVDQLGYVFKDIEKQAEIMENMFGLSKFNFLPDGELPMKYHGKEVIVKSKLAFSKLGDTQIELIQWMDGDCTYKDFLDEGREGLHHIGVHVKDIDSYLRDFKGMRNTTNRGNIGVFSNILWIKPKKQVYHGSITNSS